MRFGTCTWVFGDESLETITRRVAAVGLDGVELYGDPSLDPRAILAVLNKYSLEIFSLTPANVDLCHPKASIRQSALEYYMQLVEFAETTGAPIVSCHGYVGRVRAVDNLSAEENWMIKSTRQIAQYAEERGVRVAIELLNRYESHLLNTVDQGLAFLRQVDAENVGLLLDAYHMNIEENNLMDAIVRAGDNLFLFHAADSNRQAIGRGHTNFAAVARGLNAHSYRGRSCLNAPPPVPILFAQPRTLTRPGSLKHFSASRWDE